MDKRVVVWQRSDNPSELEFNVMHIIVLAAYIDSCVFAAPHTNILYAGMLHSASVPSSYVRIIPCRNDVGVYGVGCVEVMLGLNSATTRLISSHKDSVHALACSVGTFLLKG